MSFFSHVLLWDSYGKSLDPVLRAGVTFFLKHPGPVTAVYWERDGAHYSDFSLLSQLPKPLRCSCRHSSDQDQNKSFMADKGDYGFTSPDFLSPKLQSFLSRTRVNSLHEGANNLSLLREGCSKDRFPHSYSSHYLLSLPQGAQRNWTYLRQISLLLQDRVRKGEQTCLPLCTVLPTLQHPGHGPSAEAITQYFLVRKERLIFVLSATVSKCGNPIAGRTSSLEE